MGEITDSTIYAKTNNCFCEVGSATTVKGVGLLTFVDVEKYTGPVYSIYVQGNGYVINKLNDRPISSKTFQNVTIRVIKLGLSAPLVDQICSMPRRSTKKHIYFNNTSGIIVTARCNKQIKILPKNEFLFSVTNNGWRANPGSAIFCQNTGQFIGIVCGREGKYGRGVDLRFENFHNKLF